MRSAIIKSLCARTPAPRGLASATNPEVARFLDEKTVERKNGEKERRLFSDAEYERRLANLRKIMREKNLTSCVFTSMHNVAYFSNFVYCAFGRPYGLVVGLEGAPVTLSALIDGGQPWRRGYGDNLVYTDWARDNFITGVRDLVRRVGGDQAGVGVECDHINLDLYRKLQSALTGCSLVDVGLATSEQRMIKSGEEIEVIKLGAETADIGGAACRGAVRDGAREWEVARAGVDAMVSHISDKAGHRGAEIMDTWVWFQSGLNTDGAHNPLTDRRIRPGDILSLNCFPMIQGYYTALERTMFYKHVPSDAALKVWEANVQVHRRGLELIRPGARCRDIAAELNDLFASLGLLQYRSFGYGHSFGVLSHYYGREAGLELREDIDTVVRPGMVISMEPMVTIPEGMEGAGGYREHDIIVINEDGSPENITKFPFGPEHNVIQ